MKKISKFNIGYIVLYCLGLCLLPALFLVILFSPEIKHNADFFGGLISAVGLTVALLIDIYKFRIILIDRERIILRNCFGVKRTVKKTEVERLTAEEKTVEIFSYVILKIHLLDGTQIKIPGNRYRNMDDIRRGFKDHWGM